MERFFYSEAWICRKQCTATWNHWFWTFKFVQLSRRNLCEWVGIIFGIFNTYSKKNELNGRINLWLILSIMTFRMKWYGLSNVQTFNFLQLIFVSYLPSGVFDLVQWRHQSDLMTSLWRHSWAYVFLCASRDFFVHLNSIINIKMSNAATQSPKPKVEANGKKEEKPQTDKVNESFLWVMVGVIRIIIRLDCFKCTKIGMNW